jgi:exonuclease SbcC
MIPLKLYMRNFMCYREQTLDFAGIHLACLTGSNGHGKSAILDALTWALWGRSRLGARRDDELIHIGQREMEVEFEFVLGDTTGSPGEALASHTESAASGLRYRVLRKRDARRRGQSALELHGWDAETERFRPLSEPTISRTQLKIVELLRMDYDTFINSAFLLQGRADEFTVKRPADRKRVLGDILGLGIYDRYEELAKNAARDRREQADQRLATVAQIDGELAREAEYSAAVQAAESELAQVEEQRSQAQETYDRVRGELSEAQAAQHRLREVEQRQADARRELERLETERERQTRRLRELEEALAEEQEIESQYAAYQQALAENDAFGAKLTELVSLNQRHSELEQQIATARHGLDMERHSAAERVRQLEEVAARTEEQGQEWQEIQNKLDYLDEREAQREQAQTEIQELTARGAALDADNNRAKEDAAQIKEKMDLLEAAGESALCPLCGQPLGVDDCSRLLDQLEADLETERANYGQRMEQMRENQQKVQELRTTVSEIGRELQQRTGWRRKEAALGHLLREARSAYDVLPAARQELADLAARLDKRDYALEAHAQRAEIERQLGKLGYDAAAHRAVQAQIEATKGSEARMRTLEQARSGMEVVRSAQAQVEQSLAQAQKRLHADGEMAAGLRRAVEGLPALQNRAIEALQILETAHDREQQANLHLGAARNKLDYCSDLRTQRVKREEEERALREEQGIYQELQYAFGKNGVQAMLIEQAIPEIEEEANRLLARMTRGAMQVRFETQRDTKRGDTVETLDIHISDPLGTRAYETYSGGERYRINFAIRIALSKLLARRAGAQLRLLVIDEGFGTQDDEGRDGLIDALNAVRDDFSCILAITHIEELKNAFNVRIEVEKTAEGSEITIL